MKNAILNTSMEKNFNELLAALADTETFEITLTDGKAYKFRQLTTNQLKELVKTVVDSPLTQSVFNTTLSKIMKESLVGEGSFNVIDRLLFAIETRIQSLSPSVTITQDERSTTIDLIEVRNKLVKAIADNSALLEDKSFETSQLKLTFGVPSVKTETQLNEELYKNVDINVQTPEELRKILGDAFINEIAKAIKTIEISDKTMDLSSVNFKARLKTVESLPASSIQKVIEYIEQHKKAIEDCLIVSEGVSVPIDGSLFSLR